MNTARSNPLVFMTVLLSFTLLNNAQAAQCTVYATLTGPQSPNPPSTFIVELYKEVTPMNFHPVPPDWWDGFNHIPRDLVWVSKRQLGMMWWEHTYSYDINGLLTGSYRADVYNTAGGGHQWVASYPFTVP